MDRREKLYKVIGPGLLFASSAIGTSHLVLATRAGAHHGMIFLWIILLALLLKYPFYEFGPRYATSTGYSLVKAYKDQGNWAVYLFMLVISVNMFAVVAAIAAVSAGLLSTMFGFNSISVPILSGIILLVTVLILLTGGFKGLDVIVKCISVILLLTVTIAFIAVIIKGPVEQVNNYSSFSFLEGAGLALLVSLLGWMPAGMEASIMNSIWTIEKSKSSNYNATLKESLFDFNLGYVFTGILALMFLTIGAFTVYGSGALLDGNATQFSNKLLNIFTQHLGNWSYYLIAISAFGTIYGTLITVLDAFPRCFVRGLRVLKYEEVQKNAVQQSFIAKGYNLTVCLVAIGAFCLFYFSAASMIQLLQYVTIISFIMSPIIAFLNLKAINSKEVLTEHKPSRGLIYLAYAGMFAMLIFSVYYLVDLIS